MVLRGVILLLSLGFQGQGKLIAYFWPIYTHIFRCGKKISLKLPSEDRGLITYRLPVIPLLFPVPDRPENGHDHGQHHQKTDAEERPEQKIHHGNPLPPLGAMKVRPRVSYPPNEETDSLYTILWKLNRGVCLPHFAFSWTRPATRPPRFVADLPPSPGRDGVPRSDVRPHQGQPS